jgi:DNA-binding NarL/FixJ family response regulator
MISYLIADDHEIFRHGVRNVLNKDPNIVCVGEAQNGKELMTMLRTAKPDVLLLDIKMPEMDGVEVVTKMKELYPDVKILILTMYDDDEVVLHMLDLGVNGYLTKTSTPNEITNAIHKVCREDYYLNDMISRLMLKSRQQKNNLPLQHKNGVFLNDKEKEVLRLMCQEMTTNEIGKQIYLSPRTVEGIRRNLLDKLEVRSSTGLIIYALKTGIAEKK